MKKIITGQKARKQLLKGAKLMYDCVAITLGPRGRNVALARQWSQPRVLHDGVSVARDVESKNEHIDMGVQMIRGAALKTVSECSDGTTTSTILSYHLIDKGMKLLEQGTNPMALRKEIEAEIPKLQKAIKELATPMKSREDIKRVATISSADESVGEMIAEAMEKVGDEGQITVDESKTHLTSIEYTDGMTFKKGFSHPWLVTNPEKMEAVVQMPLVAVLAKKMTLAKEIMPLLNVMADTSINKTVLLVGEISGDALNAIVLNKTKGNINALVCDVPGYGENRKQILSDIAVMTGATVIADEIIGLAPEQFAQQFNPKWLGYAKSAIATGKQTMIIPVTKEDATSKEDREVARQIQEAVSSRIAQIKSQLDNQESEYDKELLEERLARLTTGVAIIRVGAKTEVELPERVERVKDAVGAARAVVDEGVVPGGGVAFLKIAKVIDTVTEGGQILYDTLHEVTRKLMVNAGEDLEKINKLIGEMEFSDGNIGYEVNSGEMKDLVEAGIIDPAKVIRLSLENAISVATTILSTDCLIAIPYVDPSNKD